MALTGPRLDHRSRPWHWNDVMVGLALLAGLMVAQTMLVLQLREGGVGPVQLQVLRLFPTVLTAYGVLWLAHWRGFTLGEFGFTRRRILWPAFIAWTVCIASGPLVSRLLAFAAIDVEGVLDLLRVPGLIALAVGIVVVAPVVEEVIFRALVFRWIRQRWALWPAALLSGLVFAAFHLDPVTLVPLTLTGVALAWAYDRTGSLWASIVPHAGLNALVLLALVVQ